MIDMNMIRRSIPPLEVANWPSLAWKCVNKATQGDAQSDLFSNSLAAIIIGIGNRTTSSLTSTEDIHLQYKPTIHLSHPN